MRTVVQIEKVSPPVPKRFRAEDFRKMTEVGILPEESGWEVIDGYLIDKMSIGSRHAGTVNELTQSLIILLGRETIVAVQNPVHIDDYNEPEPDIALLKPRKDFYKRSHATPRDVLLLIEVYSQPKNGNYRLARILESGETIEAVAIENLTLKVDEILGL